MIEMLMIAIVALIGLGAGYGIGYRERKGITLNPYFVSQDEWNGDIALCVGTKVQFKDGKTGYITKYVLKGWNWRGAEGPFVVIDSIQYLNVDQFWRSIERINGRPVMLHKQIQGG